MLQSPRNKYSQRPNLNMFGFQTVDLCLISRRVQNRDFLASLDC